MVCFCEGELCGGESILWCAWSAENCVSKVVGVAGYYGVRIL